MSLETENGKETLAFSSVNRPQDSTFSSIPRPQVPWEGKKRSLPKLERTGKENCLAGEKYSGCRKTFWNRVCKFS